MEKRLEQVVLLCVYSILLTSTLNNSTVYFRRQKETRKLGAIWENDDNDVGIFLPF